MSSDGRFQKTPIPGRRCCSPATGTPARHASYSTRCPEPRTAKNRLHLDLVSGTFDAETARLLRLGAQRLRDLQTDEARWTTFADIEGNEFDLIARWPSRPAHCAFGRLNAGQRRRRSMGNQGGSHRRRHGQPTRPFSGPICRLLPRPGRPMKLSSAWLTSSAWVQMIACGPPAMTVERALFSNAGSLLPVAS